MGKHGWAARAVVLSAVLWGSACEVASAQSVTAVPQLDMNRFSGGWYQVASLPEKRQKRCVADVRMLFAFGDKANSIELVNSCKTKAGYTDAKNFDGKTQDKLRDGKFKLGFWPLYRKYWVLATEPDYQWSLVGSPNHKNLWIYSRTPSLTPETMTEIRAKAATQGFAVDKMVTLPQTLE